MLCLFVCKFNNLVNTQYCSINTILELTSKQKEKLGFFKARTNKFTNKLYSCRRCTYIVYVYVVISDHADLQHVPIKTSILRYLPVSVMGYFNRLDNWHGFCCTYTYTNVIGLCKSNGSLLQVCFLFALWSLDLFHIMQHPKHVTFWKVNLLSNSMFHGVLWLCVYIEIAIFDRFYFT